ncbi:uncharacterized protein LOC109821128 [Asparagus officinalis]|uniref:uncharacterized protein LOC109821128 n=2 Tax=Asparagus officinalis TaxID=4686 RepID=UPI00098DE215|nr:uncharacterized protein LOC109821128 [Asparagus officinalis]
MSSSSSSSDDEMMKRFFLMGAAAVEEEEQGKGSTSVQHKRRTVLHRYRLEGHNRLFPDYFADTPTYPLHYFRRRFRMSRSLFLRIHDAVVEHDKYFVQKRNGAGQLGLSSLQKITAAMRMLAYGASADAVDDYVRIGKSTSLESVKRFVRSIINIFGEEYLRSPTNEDVARLLEEGSQRGFPGMLGSIDCMHWVWKNCPTAWQGMYTGHFHEPTIILEAVASKDLWIWHAFFGLPGSHNDLNVLHRSPVFAQLAEGRASPCNYTVNGHEYNMGYYLADGIYPEWSTLVKTIPAPRGNKHKYFAQQQESARKDVERAFGVLQARFAIVRGPGRFWQPSVLKDIMTACIIMHNMIVEDERDCQLDNNFDFNDSIPVVEPSHVQTVPLTEFIQNHHRIRNTQTHKSLKNDLIEHLWQLKGSIDED